MPRRILATVILAGLIGIFTISVWIPVFIFRPTRLSPSNPTAWGLSSAREVVIPSGKQWWLSGWWAPPPSQTARVVLILHGRSANISTRAPIAAKLAADGIGVLLVDYRGYGQSTGRPSETGMTHDAEAAYDWLLLQGVGPDRIIVIGQSLGNAPAAKLGASRSVRALVLVSPFTNLPDAMADRLTWLPLGLLPWPQNRFEVEPSVERVKAPVLLVASHQDELVPFSNSRKLATHARDVHSLVLDGQRHDGLLLHAAATDALSRALDALPQTGPSGGASR